MRRTLEWLQDSSTPGRHAAWAGVSCVLVLAWLAKRHTHWTLRRALRPAAR